MKKPLPRAVILSCALLGSIQNSAAAQDVETMTKDGTASEKKSKEPEKIQITGSRLKRSDVEGISSVVQVDEEAIKKSGVNTVGEVLQNMAVSIDGSYSAPIVADPSNRGNVTSVNIRGLGAQNTLVLLDGRRLPDEGGMGIVDLSQFPIAAVERIEILKESASAIYGSDASGGVVNIITKKDFEGSAVFLRASKPKLKGGAENSFSYVNGVQGDNYKVLTALSYRHVDPVYWRDRDWAKDGVSTYGLPGNIGLTTINRDPNGTSLTNEDGSFQTTTAYYAAPTCPADSPRSEDGQCLYNYANHMAFAPETTQLGALSNFDYRVNDKVSFFTSLRAQQNENLWNMAPNAGPFIIPAATLAARPALNLSGQTLAPGSNATVKYRASAWGNRTFEETVTTLGGTVGLKGELNSGWDWTVSAGRSQSKKDQKSPDGFFVTDTVAAGIANGSFDPFQTNLTDPGVTSLVAASAYDPTVAYATQMNTYDLSVSGDLFALPGGNAGLALGVSRFDQRYEKTIDDLSEANGVFGVLENQGAKGDRAVNAVYAELLMPITKSLEMQLAVRHDQYSDFGSTTNPKLGAKYRPISGLLFRGNVGTGFKAPTLNAIHDGGTIGYKNLYDTPNIATNPGRQDEVEIETYGNSDLKEETSLSYSAGVVIDPIEQLSLTADYWYVRINDVITPVDAQRALDAAAAGTPLPGIEIIHVNNDPTGPLQRLRVPTANLGKSEDAGIDLFTEFRTSVDKARLNVSNDYSRKFYSKTVPYPGADQVNYLGERGHPEWRMTSTGTVGFGGHDLSLRNNIIGKQKKTPSATEGGTISSFSTYDAQYQWTHPWQGSIALGALNIFDKAFPRDDNERVGDDQRVMELYSANGVTLYVNVNQTF